MSHLNLYYPDGTLIKGTNPEMTFLDFYSKSYYCFASKEDEIAIMKILKDGMQEETIKDIIAILEWKTGASYSREERKVKTRSKNGILIDCFSRDKRIDKLIGLKDNTSEKSAEELFQALKGINGLNSTYIITFLFFASKGKYPIYDKYVRIALDMLGEKPGTFDDKYKMIADKNTKKKYWEDYKRYRDDLERAAQKLGGVKYLGYEDEHRILDRALWVYGHLYKTKS